MTINYKDKYNQQLQSIKDNYKTFDLPYNGKDNDDYVNGQGFCCNDGTPEAAQARTMARTRAVNGNFKPNDDYEKMQFFYHPDHLGSSNYITNLDGEVSQHIEYVPFGEVFIEERNNTWNTPYLFNAKEFDEETGMYYYGARYYEPRLSLWMSVDRFTEKYPQLSAYCYCAENPIKFEDFRGDSLNMSIVKMMDKRYFTNNLDKITEDLKLITGLDITVSGDYMQYEKDAHGNPIYDQGSETARKFLMEIIDGPNIDVFVTNKRSVTPNGGNQVGLSASQIEDFIENTYNLNTATLGWGMTLLHELHHTGPGGSMVDTDELYGTGDVVNAMNVIRQELNMQWKNFGQRLNYKSVIPNEGATNSYLPFDQSSLNCIKEGVAPCVFSEYIKTSVKK